MNTVLAQVWFFQDIQKAFRKGVDPDVMTSVLLKFFLVAVPLILFFVYWRNRDKVRFFLVRAYNIRKHEKARLRIAQHFKKRNVSLEVYLVGKSAQQFLGRASIAKFGQRKMLMGFLTDVPNALSRVITGKRIICYFRPFKVGGERVNSFYTYVVKTVPGVNGIKSLLLQAPAEYTNTVRRSSPRKKVARPGAVRAKLWGSPKKEKFLVLAPDFETTDQQDERNSWKASNKVVNISSGGMKLQVHPRKTSDAPKVNEQVVLDLMVLNKDQKSFENFLLLGVVRNISRPPNGAVFLGIQFTSRGVRTGSRAVSWHPVRGDLPDLQDLLG